MPKVTKNFAGQRSAPLQRSRANVSAFMQPGQALSRTSQQVGQQVTGAIENKMRRDAAVIVANTLATIEEKSSKDFLEAQRNSVSSVQNPDNEAKLNSLGILVPQGQGSESDSTTLPFSEHLLGVFDKDAEEALSKISNPYAKQELAVRLPGMRGRLAEQSVAYEARASYELRKELLTDAANKYNQAVFNDPSSFNAKLADLVQFVDGSGLPTADIKERKRLLSNTLARNATLGLIDSQPGLAAEVLDNEKSDIRKNLTPDQIFELKGRLNAKNRADTAQVRQKVTRQLPDQKQSLLETGQGIPGFEGTVAVAYSDQPQVAKDILDELEAYRSAYKHSSNINGLALNELSAYLNKVKPEPGSDNFKVQSQMHSILTQMAQNQIALAQKDPVAFSMSVAESEFEGIKEEEDPRRFAEKSLAIQQAKGVPTYKQRLMSNARRDAIIETIESVDANDVISTMQSYMQEYDAVSVEEQTLSGQFLKELTMKEGGISPTYGFVLSNLADNNQKVAHDLVRSIRQGKELRTQLQTDSDKRDFDERVNDELEDYASGLLQGSAENIVFVNDTKEAVKNLALLYMAESSDAKGDTTRSVRKAVDMLVTRRVDNVGSPLMVPRQLMDGDRQVNLRASQVELGLSSLLTQYQKNRTGLDIDEEITFGGQQDLVDQDELKKELIDIALRDSYWKSVGDFSHAVLMLPIAPDGGFLPAKNSKGELLTVDLLSANEAGSVAGESIQGYADIDLRGIV